MQGVRGDSPSVHRPLQQLQSLELVRPTPASSIVYGSFLPSMIHMLFIPIVNMTGLRGAFPMRSCLFQESS